MSNKKSLIKSGGKKKAKARAKRAKKRDGPEPIYKAIFGKRASVSPAKKYGRDTRKANAFEKIVSLVRVQQDIARTPLERQASATCAVNMCNRHGIELTDAMEQIQFSKNKYQGSSSTVIIKHTNPNKTNPVRIQTFLVDICDAIEMMFDCDAFTEMKKGNLRVAFFGIASNTISAQLAFKLCYSQAVDLGRTLKGNGPRNSYLLGLAKGLWERAMRRRVKYEGDIKKAQEMAATTFADHDFEADDDYEPDFNFDKGSWGQDPNATAVVKSEEVDDNSKALVRVNNADEEEDEGDNDDEEDEDEDYSEGSYNWVQLMLAHNDYRTKVKKTAASWLKDQGIKLRTLGSRKRNIRFQELFEQGREDSNDIDLGEKRIGDVLRLDMESQANEENEADDATSTSS